jgi:hypothetical protein
LLLAGIAVIAIFIRSEDVTQIDAAEVAVPA